MEVAIYVGHVNKIQEAIQINEPRIPQNYVNEQRWTGFLFIWIPNIFKLTIKYINADKFRLPHVPYPEISGTVKSTILL